MGSALNVDNLESMGSSTSHNLIRLQSLLQGSLYSLYYFLIANVVGKLSRRFRLSFSLPFG
jgi:hypothetical protein